ncbi:MAG: methyltransferase family protein [Acidobacteriota bacterium]
MTNPPMRPGPPLIVAVAGALVFVGSLVYFLARYAWGMDGAPTGPAGPAVLFNVVLFTIFALHHSILARTPAKAWVTRAWPPALERSLYTWVASLLFIAVCRFWQPVPGGLWDVQGSGRTVMRIGQLVAAVFVLVSARRLDVLDLAGVRQVLNRGRNSATHGLYVRGPYALVRHPIYLGWILFVSLAPTMNGTRLLFALVSSAYLFVAVPFEERDLIKTFGAAYEQYCQRVRWKIVPYLH